MNAHYCILCLPSIWVIPASKRDLFPIARNSWCFWKNTTQCTPKSNIIVPCETTELHKFCSSATNRSFAPFIRNALVLISRLLLYSRAATQATLSLPDHRKLRGTFSLTPPDLLCLVRHPLKEPPQGVGRIQAVHLTHTYWYTKSSHSTVWNKRAGLHHTTWGGKKSHKASSNSLPQL